MALATLSSGCSKPQEAPLAITPYDESQTPAATATPPEPAPEASAPHHENEANPGAMKSVGPGFPEPGPWVSIYGSARDAGDLDKLARTYRIINIDADPTEDGVGNFTNAQIAKLKRGGKNRVISYFNIGACERFRTYWKHAPTGFVSCGSNQKAQRGIYKGYPDETWMDLGDTDYQHLIVDHVAPRLARRGIDGFYLDNYELLGHGPNAKEGRCDAKCVQGGLDIVRKLREKFPKLVIVMQNGTGDVTRLGKTGERPFPTLLDGIAHEEVYAPQYDEDAERELLAWQKLNIKTEKGTPFWIATEDYVGSCKNRTAAKKAIAQSQARGFSPYVSDESGSQKRPCYW